MTRPLLLGLAMAAICLWASAGEARADSTLWYNGDYDGFSGAYNAVVPSASSYALVYDDFIVPVGQTWTIHSVFSNDQMNFTPSTLFAHWAIRSGVTGGDGGGGTLLAFGTDSATQVPTANVDVSEYTVAVSGLNVTLGPGTYWLTVDPVGGSLDDLSYMSTTSGTNAIGMPPGNDGNSYLAGSYWVSVFGSNFVPAGDLIQDPNNNGQADFSMGVTGVAMASVPEPSTLVLGLLGTLTVFGTARLRRRRTRVG